MGKEINITRKNGQRIRLVAEDFTQPCNEKQIAGVYAVVIEADGRKRVVSDNDARPIPKGMSVEEYKKSEFRGIFSVITYAEYLKVIQKLFN